MEAIRILSQNELENYLQQEFSPIAVINKINNEPVAIFVNAKFIKDRKCVEAHMFNTSTIDSNGFLYDLSDFNNEVFSLDEYNFCPVFLETESKYPF